ncbi:hypothetical protein D3C77_502880 [compost metagenome]
MVQGFDPLGSQLQQSLILGQRLLRSVYEIAEEREVQVLVAVGQKAYLQPFDQLLDITGAGHQARDRNQAAGLGRNPLPIVQARQKTGHDGQRHQPVDQADCQAAGHQQYGYGEPCQNWRGPAIIVDRLEEDPAGKDQRE